MLEVSVEILTCGGCGSLSAPPLPTNFNKAYIFVTHENFQCTLCGSRHYNSKTGCTGLKLYFIMECWCCENIGIARGRPESFKCRRCLYPMDGSSQLFWGLGHDLNRIPGNFLVQHVMSEHGYGYGVMQLGDLESEGTLIINWEDLEDRRRRINSGIKERYERVTKCVKLF